METKSIDKSLIAFFIGVVVLIALGPFLGQKYIYHVLILCFIWTILIAGWDLVMGYAGILSFAQLVFFAVGAYSSAMLTLNLGFNPVLAIACATIISVLLAALIALPCLRLRGEYIALFTFATALAFPTLIEQGRALGTGGTSGLMGMKSIEIAGYKLFAAKKLPWYYITLCLASISVYLIYFVALKSRMGRAFIALRDSEEFARSIGIDEYQNKILAFSFSGLFAGLAGALYANYIGVVTPSILGNEFFLMVMVMISIGGMGKFPGAVLGAFTITIGNEFLRDFGEYRLLILGLIVVVVLLYLPGGLADIGRKFRKREPAKS